MGEVAPSVLAAYGGRGPLHERASRAPFTSDNRISQGFGRVIAHSDPSGQRRLDSLPIPKKRVRDQIAL
jgi:hypothetical protein